MYDGTDFWGIPVTGLRLLGHHEAAGANEIEESS
jgi:hypothetical protein